MQNIDWKCARMKKKCAKIKTLKFANMHFDAKHQTGCGDSLLCVVSAGSRMSPGSGFVSGVGGVQSGSRPQ